MYDYTNHYMRIDRWHIFAIPKILTERDVSEKHADKVLIHPWFISLSYMAMYIHEFLHYRFPNNSITSSYYTEKIFRLCMTN